MSGIAELLLALDFPVTGSDLYRSRITDRLESLGAKICIGHKKENLEKPACVVVSTAVQRDNPEWQEAVARAIPVIPRAEMLAELMRLKKGIAVAGSHGKTTTTSLTGQLLKPLDPTVVVGGRLQHWDASSIAGKGPYFIIEADESDRSFLHYSPVYSIVTNIDREHLDTYRDLDDIKECFLRFLNRTAFFGRNMICADCEELMSLRPKIAKPVSTYGFSEKADYRIRNYSYSSPFSYFELVKPDGESLSFKLPVAGQHNVKNAAAAIGLGLELGLSPRGLKQRLQHFVMADRRLQRHFENEKLAVIEDYAHHPVEIEACLSAIREMYPDRRLGVVFQPHRYSRTQFLWDDFVRALSQNSDDLWLLPIYGAHENPLEGVSSDELFKHLNQVRRSHQVFHPVQALPGEPGQLQELLLNGNQEAQVVVFLGAAPLTKFAQALSLPANR